MNGRSLTNIYHGQKQQQQKHPMYPWRPCSSLTPSSSSSSSFFYDEVYENQVMKILDEREQIHREMEKKRIREEIVAEEEMRRRQLGAFMGMSSSVMLRPEISLGGYENRFNDNVYGKSVVVMPLSEIYSHGGGGSHRREVVADELPFQRAPRFKEMAVHPTNNGKMEILGKGKPCDVTNSKRKEPPLPSPPSRAGSIGFGLETTTKKLKGEWSCDVCKIRATSENGLKEHLAGKKHQTKVAALKSHNDVGSEIGLAKVNTSVNEQSIEISVIPKENGKTKGETAKQTFKTWCKICKVKTTSEQSMRKHKEGKQHLKKLLSRERAKNKTRLAGKSKSIRA